MRSKPSRLGWAWTTTLVDDEVEETRVIIQFAWFYFIVWCLLPKFVKRWLDR